MDEDAWEIVSSDNRYTCGIKDKKIYCWGENYAGQLGDGTMVNRQTPVKIADKNWKTVSTSGMTTFAIDEENELYQWGGSYNTLASNEFIDQMFFTEPVRVDDENWLHVSTGNNHTCGIRSDNRLYCWGYNGSLQLGFYNTEDMSVNGTVNPKKVNDEVWLSVHAGLDQTCALNMEKLLYCWGNYLYYNCYSYPQDHLIKQVSEKKWREFDMMTDTYCGITEENDLYCWGSNGIGQVGIGEISSSYVCDPSKVGQLKWKNISVGSQRTCGIDIEGYLYCWGSNPYGLLGIEVINGKYYSGIPKKVGRKKWESVSVGSNHVCAIDDYSNLFCWGYNFAGELGNNLAWVEEKFRVLK
jgi:alpha-tubulin suppressor-like RCC1 family protein